VLNDLNDAQREAVCAASGPLVILAGAGTGKTRVISRRAAHAIETGVVPANNILLVTFTDKAANEMVARMSALGHPSVMARTFHSHAVRQLRHFWPSRHGGADPPQVLDSKLPLIGPLARHLPGHYKFTPAKDIADAIEWAKVRRIPPNEWENQAPPDRAPIPPDLFARIYAGYERAKDRAHRVDFEDMLALTVELLESDDEARHLVQSQKTWISVDEYQDTNPLQERLLELWLGDSRDLAVVGDPDQTIYTFTGATPVVSMRILSERSGALEARGGPSGPSPARHGACRCKWRLELSRQRTWRDAYAQGTLRRCGFGRGHPGFGDRLRRDRRAAHRHRRLHDRARVRRVEWSLHGPQPTHWRLRQVPGNAAQLGLVGGPVSGQPLGTTHSGEPAIRRRSTHRRSVRDPSELAPSSALVADR